MGNRGVVFNNSDVKIDTFSTGENARIVKVYNNVDLERIGEILGLCESLKKEAFKQFDGERANEIVAIVDGLSAEIRKSPPDKKIVYSAMDKLNSNIGVVSGITQIVDFLSNNISSFISQI